MDFAMMWVLAGIVVIVGFLGLTELLLKIWEALDPPAKIEEVRNDGRDYRRAA